MACMLTSVSLGHVGQLGSSSGELRTEKHSKGTSAEALMGADIFAFAEDGFCMEMQRQVSPSESEYGVIFLGAAPDAPPCDVNKGAGKPSPLTSDSDVHTPPTAIGSDVQIDPDLLWLMAAAVVPEGRLASDGDACHPHLDQVPVDLGPADVELAAPVWAQAPPEAMQEMQK